MDEEMLYPLTKEDWWEIAETVGRLEVALCPELRGELKDLIFRLRPELGQAYAEHQQPER